jgi:hypothetical protein
MTQSERGIPELETSPYFSVLGVLVFASILLMILAQAHSQRIESILYLGRWVPLGLLMSYAVSWWALTRRWEGPAIRRAEGFDAWMLGWIGFAYISLTYSVAPETTVVMATTFLLGYGGVFWGIWHFADRFGEEKVVILLLWAGAAVIIAGWGALVFGYGSPLQGYGLQSPGYQSSGVFGLGARFRGILENPNALGQLSALISPLILARGLRTKNFSTYLFLALTVITLMLTGNRSGIGAAAVASGYVLWKAENVDRRIALTFLLGAIGLGLYGLRGEISSILVRADTLDTASRRVAMWDLFSEYIQNRPLIGHGWGTEDLLHGFYGTNVEALYLRQNLAASSYIGITAQVGLIGAAAFFLPLLWLAGHTALAWQGTSLWLHALNAVLLVGLIVAVTQSWMSSMGHAKALTFWVPVMLLIRRRVTARRAYRKRHSVRRGRASPA